MTTELYLNEVRRRQLREEDAVVVKVVNYQWAALMETATKAMKVAAQMRKAQTLLMLKARKARTVNI